MELLGTKRSIKYMAKIRAITFFALLNLFFNFNAVTATAFAQTEGATQGTPAPAADEHVTPDQPAANLSGSTTQVDAPQNNVPTTGAAALDSKGPQNFDQENVKAKEAEFKAKDPKESAQVMGPGDIQVQRLDKTKIYSCDITFPLNSVTFDENLVMGCFKGIDMKKVSYIHIVATATITGTTAHNFYLSTRRAGGLEAFLQNRYPDVQVHAFGGGENPKFGKSARIFVVESADEPLKELPVVQTRIKDNTPPTPAAKIVYQTKIEKEYVYPKKLGLDLRVTGGLSEFRANSTHYQTVGMEILKNVNLPIIHEFAVGAAYSLARSNQKLDAHSANVIAEKFVPVWHYGRSTAVLEVGLQGQSGVTQIEKDRQANAGGAGLIRYRDKGLTALADVGMSRHFRWFGLGMGTSF